MKFLHRLLSHSYFISLMAQSPEGAALVWGGSRLTSTSEMGKKEKRNMFYCMYLRNTVTSWFRIKRSSDASSFEETIKLPLDIVKRVLPHVVCLTLLPLLLPLFWGQLGFQGLCTWRIAATLRRNQSSTTVKQKQPDWSRNAHFLCALCFLKAPSSPYIRSLSKLMPPPDKCKRKLLL